MDKWLKGLEDMLKPHKDEPKADDHTEAPASKEIPNEIPPIEEEHTQLGGNGHGMYNPE